MAKASEGRIREGLSENDASEVEEGDAGEKVLGMDVGDEVEAVDGN